jgi:hypothetical protein
LFLLSFDGLIIAVSGAEIKHFLTKNPKNFLQRLLLIDFTARGARPRAVRKKMRIIHPHFSLIFSFFILALGSSGVCPDNPADTTRLLLEELVAIPLCNLPSGETAFNAGVSSQVDDFVSHKHLLSVLLSS